MGILYYIKFKFSQKHKTIFIYLVALIITNLKFLKNPKNNQINLGLKCNSII